jgi:hypothetical protein
MSAMRQQTAKTQAIQQIKHCLHRSQRMFYPLLREAQKTKKIQ